jgi:hypothetical protein
MLIAMVLAFGLFFLTGLSGTTRRLAQVDAFPRDTKWGLRTAQTTRSQEAWDAGHRAAAPLIAATSVLSFVGAVLIIITAFMVVPTASAMWTVVLVALVAYVLTLLLLLIATLVANNRARQV